MSYRLRRYRHLPPYRQSRYGLFFRPISLSLNTGFFFALFRYRSIRALCRPIGKADTGSGYGYVLTALRAYASAAAAIGMRQYAAFFAAQTSTHIDSFAPLAQTQTKTQLT